MGYDFFKWLHTFLFVYEKDRYYSGGALRYPIKITQALWDELHERKLQYENHNNSDGRKFLFIDTSYGTSSDTFEKQIGKRPIVPDKIKELRRIIFITTSFICLFIDIYIFMKHK